MIKRILILIRTVLVTYLFLSIFFPKYMAASLATPKTQKVWSEHAQQRKLEADSITKFPTPIGIINDYGKIFTESHQTELNKLLYDYNIKTTRQIVVVTIDSIKPYNNIQKYATDLANHWGVGLKEKNNGLTIVVCNPCKQIGIATGLGTKLVLTDQICEDVIVNSIVPEFKKGNFYIGIKKGVAELIEKWR